MIGGNDKYFYHSKTRKAVALFGRMFNKAIILRKNSVGNVTDSITVPLSYAPKQKFLDRINAQANLDTDQRIAVKLPRMSFEITGIQYDASRQLSKTTNFTQSSTLYNTYRTKFNMYVPYIISFSLNIFAKNQDDALQVVEQILPYFSPQYTLTIKPFPDTFPNVKEDIPVTLTGVDFSDDFEGALEQRRTIIYTLTFDMKLNYFGPLDSKGVITKAIPKIDLNNEGIADSDYLTIEITPTVLIGGDSDYGFNEVYTYGFESSG